MQISPDHVSAFRQQGYLLVSGLIQRHVASAAYDRILERTPHSGSDVKHEFIRDRLVRSCFTPELCAAAEQLAGCGMRARRPFTVYAITVFPKQGIWQWPAPHIDHALERDAHKTFPPAFHVGCLIYLNEIPSRSGGTVVWPRSHDQIEKFAAAHPARYEYLARLNQDLGKLNFGSPVEILASAGDVLFYDHLLAHAGSENTGRTPRIALNHKW